jgi:hypothetical protein
MAMSFQEHDMATEQPGEAMSDVQQNECSSDTSPLVSAAMRAKIETAFRNKQVQIQLWADGAGRVYRIQVISSTGDAQLDALIRDDVLRSLMLSEPPNEMPMVADDAAHLSADNNRQTIQHVE